MFVCVSCRQRLPDSEPCACGSHTDRGGSNRSLDDLEELLRTVAEDLDGLDGSATGAAIVDPDEDLDVRVLELLQYLSESETRIEQLQQMALEMAIAGADEDTVMEQLAAIAQLRSAVEEMRRGCTNLGWKIL